MNEKLMKYIKEKIFPEYSKNEEGHGIKHIKTVIERSAKTFIKDEEYDKALEKFRELLDNEEEFYKRLDKVIEKI